MSTVLNLRGQLKIQQMIFMLLALTLFFSLIALSYLAIKIAGLEDDARELKREKAIGLVTKLASSPEFNFEGVSRAIDADKLMILRDKEEYRDFWGVKGIIVEKIYPLSEDVECRLSNYPNCNKIKLFTNKDVAPVSSYVSLCRKQTVSGRSYNKCEIAILMLEIEL